MTPGPPCKLTCPHCGGHKHIMSIASGNTFGGTIWSDSKRDFPMLPQPSLIQYCPHCGHYFFYEDGNAKAVPSEQRTPKNLWRTKTDKDEQFQADNAQSDEWKMIREETYTNRFGELSFEQVDAAYDELSSESLTDERLNQLLFLWLFIFNDVYGGRGRVESVPVLSPALVQKHAEVLQKLINLNEGNSLFVAEMYRELGNYQKCIELTTALIQANNDGAAVAKQFQQHAKMGDCKVFPLVFEE